jgi:aspartate/methionine/tyrosine aminotransferase
MRELVVFCAEQGLVLLADEVYQENIYLEGASLSTFR